MSLFFINYIGSKLSLLQFIENGINQVVGEKNYKFSDLFAGTGIVARFFKEKGHQVIANDMQYYSFVLNKNYIGNHKELDFNNLISEIKELENIPNNKRKDFVCEYLNSLSGKPGFIYKNYSIGGTIGGEFERQYFSDENEYYFLLASLIEATDKVANTASIYGAFLKQLKKSALKPLILKPADYFYNE